MPLTDPAAALRIKRVGQNDWRDFAAGVQRRATERKKYYVSKREQLKQKDGSAA